MSDISSLPLSSQEQQRRPAILKAAETGSYGLSSVVSVRLLSFHSSETPVCDRSRSTYHQYNPETVVAIVRSAEAKRSPTQILLFPWAITYANDLPINLRTDA